MEKMIDFLKMILMILISVFAPIKSSIVVLMFFFLLNFFIGFKNDEIVHDNDFSIKKAFESIKLLLLFYAIIFIVNLSLLLFNEIELANNVTKFVTWVVSYWYLVNILRNSKEIFPEAKALPFLYDILTIHVLDAILQRFGINMKNKEDDKID